MPRIITDCLHLSVAVALLLVLIPTSHAQFLDEQLQKESVATLIEDAKTLGDAKRGAIVFYQPHTTCTKCHTAGDGQRPLGPDLLLLNKAKATPQHLVESLLQPSKKIKEGFETVTVIDTAGRSFTGLQVKDTPQAITIRDAQENGRLVTIKKTNVDEVSKSKTSIMPKGLMNALTSRQQFLDLLKYLMEVAEHGPDRALELKPAPSLYAAQPLPEYEAHIDHAGIIGSLDQEAYKRGEAIYTRLCINCHGTHDKPGSLPTSRRFATEKFKNGADPYAMYQTLTRGFGLMVAQRWMVPQQKYDVIHYIREAYLKSRNETQLTTADAAYLAKLPKGDTRGPAPSKIVPWEKMDYGPSLIASYEIGKNPNNIAYKGIAVRVDPGPGGISKGGHWMVLDHDTMRIAGAWNGKGFIDWNGIMLNGRHGIHPRSIGTTSLANPTGPGWGHPETGSFEDPRLRGRDDKPYGPLPRDWSQYKGLYHYGNQTIVKYTVGKTQILESHGMVRNSSPPIFLRHFEIGPRDRDMVMQIDRNQSNAAGTSELSTDGGSPIIVWGKLAGVQAKAPAPVQSNGNDKVVFDGRTQVQINDSDSLRFFGQDFTLTARIKTTQDGTIISKSSRSNTWAADGQTLFVRGGKLAYDIGWVGEVVSKARVADGKWHAVAAAFDAKTGTVQLYVDGNPDNRKALQAKSAPAGSVVRIGFTSGDFPRPKSFFTGDIAEVRFFDKRLNDNQLKSIDNEANSATAIAKWAPSGAAGNAVANAIGKPFVGEVIRGAAPVAQPAAASGEVLAAGLSPAMTDVQWLSDADGNARLKIPAGKQPLRFTLWTSRVESADDAKVAASKIIVEDHVLDLTAMTNGGPARWPEKLVTQGAAGPENGPFAVDVLTSPDSNPWFCRVRLTGFDFITEDRIAICAWDGDVWMVDGVATPGGKLTWHRIASGLFQPLGLKYVDKKIYVTCRDQLTILHDLNGDGETDYYESFNNDHQVTEHFHEFAMGLQTDSDGNFYYAKSARHALKAIVPHHGTLLKVSKDGSKTEIVANGFRAANGVCINPDGSFIVTDQEGHWNPKNRINWVTKGGFYGNMFGYTDVTDSSNEAMQQPLCWITNSFDRSPAELLWTESKQWGNLDGTLLNLSYGYGKVFVVPHEKINGQVQGGMCQIPIPNFPTGIIRGRFHPTNGQLYCCGMFAWAGSQSRPGGFYRIRYTGEQAYLPVGLNAKKQGMAIEFSDPVDSKTIDPKNFQVKVWSLKRTASYGSKHYDEKGLEVKSVTVSADGKTVMLSIPEIAPTWCMEIKYRFTGANGKSVSGTIHNTIHNLGD
jgi:putative heme-binding domain-containing protein